MNGPDILLTNDDGIHSAGLHALDDALSDIGSVTVVAPAKDQSAVGRTLSSSVAYERHERGYVVDGTPADCVVAGLRSLVPESDLVVAGCNTGANLGTAVLGRSGTVSAAVEAAFLDVPSMAVSMYVPPEQFADGKPDLSTDDYAEAVRATTHLVGRAPDNGVFERVDLLNVNAPTPERRSGEMVLTRPCEEYRMDSERNGERIDLLDRSWDLMADGRLRGEAGTDREAIVDGTVSVTPLSVPTDAHPATDLDGLVEDFAVR